ncbi:MAG: phosphate acyltransferase [Cyclobacteriaceae bacterium]
MNIAVDAMGGDHAPDCVLLGAQKLISENLISSTITLVGNEKILQDRAKELGVDLDAFHVVHAEETIGMEEHPTKAITQKRNSSINIGFHLLKEKKVDAFCGAGNTGAMMVGAMFSIKTIEGIIRPGIAGFFPKERGNYGILLDAGANADCKADVLDQFATVGSIYYKYLFEVDKPRVGLISLGEEKSKGTLLTQAAHQLMDLNKNIDFVGNLEGSDLFLDTSDVIVCDGFTGNVLLKMGESFYELLSKRGIQDDFLDLFNYQNMGGSPIIGLNEDVIIGHGKSTPEAIKNMILLSERIAKSGVTEKMKKELK